MDFRPSQPQQKHRAFTRALLLIAVLALRPAAPLDAASPAREFSTVNNPNGIWSYGYEPMLGGALILYTMPYDENGILGWTANLASNVPLVAYNGTDAEIDYATLTVDPGEIVLHPGPDGEYSILRFTAPAADTYRVTGSFFGRDHEGTTTDVHLLYNGLSVFDGNVDGYGPGTGPDFDQSVALAAGDTLDFAVGYGSNGNYFDDTTALLATVSPTDAATPTIAVTSPPDGITVVAGADLPLAASVADPGDVLAQVQFVIDGTPAATLTAAPFVFDTTVPTAPGAHAVQAVATDSLGRTATASVTLNVLAPAAAAVPTARVLTPVDGRNLLAGSTLTLTFAAAADASTALDHVNIYANGALVAAFNGDGTPVVAAAASGQPVRRDAPAPAGTLFQTLYTLPGTTQFVNLIAVALDKLGQSTVSKVASFQSLVTTDKAPLVAVQGVTGGAHFAVGSTDPATVVASDPDASTNAAPATGPHRADAASDASLATLEYYLNDLKLGEVFQSPASFTFTPPAAGLFVLHAVATDGSGLATVSDPVSFVADAPATTVDLAVGGSGSAIEEGANGIIIVSRTGDTASPLTVAYKAKGAAVAGVDYKKLPGSITIPAGAVKAKLKVKTIDASPNAGTLKLKLQLLVPADGSYAVGTGTVKLKLIGR